MMWLDRKSPPLAPVTYRHALADNPVDIGKRAKQGGHRLADGRSTGELPNVGRAIGRSFREQGQDQRQPTGVIDKAT